MRGIIPGRGAECLLSRSDLEKNSDAAGAVPLLDINESERTIELGCPLWHQEVSLRAAAGALYPALSYVFDDLRCLRCRTVRDAHDPDSALMCDLGSMTPQAHSGDRTRASGSGTSSLRSGPGSRSRLRDISGRAISQTAAGRSVRSPGSLMQEAYIM